MKQSDHMARDVAEPAALLDMAGCIGSHRFDQFRIIERRAGAAVNRGIDTGKNAWRVVGSTAEHDAIDIRDILSGYHQGIDNLSDFVKIEDSGANSILSVDIDGAGTAYGWRQVAVISGVTGLTDEDALVASHTLIVS